jgi:hypothetical protein
MGIPAVRSLECVFSLSREENDVSIHAEGRLCAAVTRICVVSAEEFEMPVRDEFTIRFVPSQQVRDDPDPDEPDEVPYDGSIIDLGEAAIEQLALAMDPYPRIDGATLPLLEEDAGSSPFSTLRRRPESNDETH